MLRPLAVLFSLLALFGCDRLRGRDAPPPVEANAPPSDAGTGAAPPDGAPPPAPVTGEKGPTVEVDGLAALVHKPLVVLTEVDPWRGVIGSDVPTTVLYEDGLVISHRGEGASVTAWRASAPKEVAALAARIVTPELMTLPAHNDLVSATDQPTVRILARSGATWKLTEVYGLRRGGPSPSMAQRASAPKAFADAYRALLEVEVPNASPWAPEQVEIMLWDFSHTKKPPRPWPSSIPAPPPDAEYPKRGGVYKHLVAGSLEPEVKRFLASLEPAQAVRIGDRSLSMSVRRVIPEESYIRRVMACAWRRASPRATEPAPEGCR